MVARRAGVLLAALLGVAKAEHRQCVRAEPERCILDASEGPADADIEVKLSGLPASTSTEAVHLNWWAARKSPRPYNPLNSLVNCSVYGSMHHAYPNFDDEDFNGGNVQVTSSGEATIRIRSPAAHMVWQWVSLPHIHLRLCNQSGTDAHVMKLRPQLAFTGNEVWTWPRSESLKVVSAHAYAAKDAGKAPKKSSETEPPLTWITWASTDTDQETTTRAPVTTSTAPITTTTTLEKEKPVLSMPDMGALEASPVYDCLIGKQVYDHFTGSCADACPLDKDTVHGQCVKKAVIASPQNYSAAWDLSLECGDRCWTEARNGTLHQLRLIVATELRVPFQEVEVAMELKAALARRLAEGSAYRAFHMTVDVRSARVTAESFSETLKPFPHDAAALTAILGMPVGSISRANPLPTPPDDSLMNDKQDPFTPAYDDAERKMMASSPLDGLPTVALACVAAGILAMGLAFGVVIVCRRRRQRKFGEEAAQQAQLEKKAQAQSDIEGADKPSEAEQKVTAETQGDPKRWI